MAKRPHTVVIGGGVAGLSVAWPLAADRRVTLLEQEDAHGTHSSARNAQIWLPLDDDETTGPLALTSAARMTELLGEEERWLRRSGAIALTAPTNGVEGLRRGAERSGVSLHPMTRDELQKQCPILEADVVGHRVRGAGVLDPHAMVTALARAGRDAGVSARTGSKVSAIEADRAVRAVVLEDGTRIACDEVVIAAGAWSASLGRSVGRDIPLVPLRRHLVLLDADPAAASTVVWRFDEPAVYWRPESGGVLASPCDEVAFDPCLPTADPAALEWLAEALTPTAPSMVNAPVRTHWACLRTYANDRELVLGPDPALEGLAWIAGLGGRGMTVGVGAGDLCARAMRGESNALTELTRPDRPQPGSMVPPA